MLRLRIIRRPLAQLLQGHLNSAGLARIKDAYRFSSVDEVEMLSRVMRKWDLDGKLDVDALAFGEFILKVCGSVWQTWCVGIHIQTWCHLRGCASRAIGVPAMSGWT